MHVLTSPIEHGDQYSTVVELMSACATVKKRSRRQDTSSSNLTIFLLLHGFAISHSGRPMMPPVPIAMTHARWRGAGLWPRHGEGHPHKMR
jgi:hypothetical protein